MRIAFCRAVAFALIVVAIAKSGHAQTYPAHPIRVIVGPGPDIVARLFAPKMTDLLGQPVIVEPRPGAGGVIAAQSVANAPADGYMLLQATASYTINTALGTLPLDLAKDLAPIALVSTTPFVLVVNPSLPVKNLGELIAYAKANPGKLNYASSGVGTPPHLAGELFKAMAGVDIVHVPFREANSALNSVVSGATQMMFSIASVAQAQIAGRTVRGIAVTSPKTSPLVPGLPSLGEAGLPGFAVIGWNGFVAPKGTSAAIVARLNAALTAGLDDATLRDRLNGAGYELAAKNTPQEFSAFIAADTAKWLDLVAKTRMKAN
ncbi:MAG TPA: tripartite tricarboxylate transporter substrate binding protein [Xanthobacteraceae bacterium]